MARSRSPLLALAAASIAFGACKSVDSSGQALVTSGPDAAVASAKPTTMKVVAPAACLFKDARNGSIVHVEPTATGMRACYSESDYVHEGHEVPCVDVDVATRAQSQGPNWRVVREVTDSIAPFGPNIAHFVRRDADVVDVTPGTPVDPVHTRPTRHVRPGFSAPSRIVGGSAAGTQSVLNAAVSDDESKLFVLHTTVDAGKDPALVASWKTTGETFDTATSKRLDVVDLYDAGATTLRALHDPTDQWMVTWVGDQILIRARASAGPSVMAELVDPHTGKFLPLGDLDAFVKLGPNAAFFGTDAWPYDASGARATDARTLHGRLAILEVSTHATIVERAFDTERVSLERISVRTVPAPDGRLAVALASPPRWTIVDARAKTIAEPTAFRLCE